ncbi:hypothetical protein [Novosphingobium sp. AAP93]|uniref:hypothetical protein n=1 Tax=Novosphingobium sp. AAP93 TaxID=1523427 RepID=UPI0006BA09ED|nr:hypothetical protein [Novosphingobium sp. AAP93]
MTLVLLGDAPQVVRRVPQGEARCEAVLRDLIADHPALLPVHDIDPSYGKVVTVTTELSIPSVGFVDVLLMDEFGRLIVVECKLWRNPQARREVVGQILDYARELSRFAYDDLQRQVSIATKRTGNVLYTLAREAGSNLPEADFVDRVTRDLAAGRFLLLVVGDGIAEGTRRIGEYLRDQPGLAFSFALIEMAEYRHTDADGIARAIMHPRVLAQTVLIERHVIRSEVPGLVIDATSTIAPAGDAVGHRAPSEAGTAWRAFADKLLAEMRFDDPGQPPARNGGMGWVRVPLPGGFYVNVYRSAAEGGLGAQVRFPGAEGEAVAALLREDADAIAAEFASAGLSAPTWVAGDVCTLSLTMASAQPWDGAAEEAQRAWMAKAANQFVNSLRPRLQRLG